MGTEASVRLMAPATRSALDRWEISRDGKVIGFIQAKKLSGARSPFFEALACLPGKGDLISLELDTDFDRQLAAIVRFAENPEEFARHLPAHWKL